MRISAFQLPSLVTGLATVAVLAIAMVSGCASPVPQGGSRGCASNADCPDGYACYPDKSCYQKGTIVDCQPPCAGATPKCDQTTLRCVACLQDADCPVGMVCAGNSCHAGCSAKHTACAPDGGRCDVDMGACRGCLADGECTNPDRPRCEKFTGLCVPCLPDKDNCPTGRYCVSTNNQYQCAMGCKVTADCGQMGTVQCCNHQCTDVAHDPANCAACGTSCNGKSCCGSLCADLMSDADNCGNCGGKCQIPNGAAKCAGGMCAVGGCNGGFADCNGSPNDGCEVRLSMDLQNCGACKKACGAVANATPACVSGSCSYTCVNGFRDCDNDLPKNGCEANLQTDARNCGGCGNACPIVPNGTAGCAGGQCVIGSCNMGFRDCDQNVIDGCEVRVDADLNNCGGCGVVCPGVPNGTAVCAGGVCKVGTCGALFGDCDNNIANGCETNLGMNLANCGACGKVCPGVANGVPGCANGMCDIASCNAQFADCDGVVANGCEINLANNAAHCGSCGVSCIQGQQCLNGACVGGGGCLNGGKVPPATCVNGNDPETGDSYTICTADCTTAWISSTKANGGHYHATQICNLYGYGTLGQISGNCGDICGYCQANTTCNSRGPKTFDGGGNSCGSDGFGQILCFTVMWTCLK